MNLDWAWFTIALIWLLYLPQGLGGLMSFLKVRRQFIYGGPPTSAEGLRLVFQITTFSAIKAKGSVQEAISKVRGVWPRAEVLVVSDDPDDENLGLDASVMIVPRDYRTNTIRKARALQYAIEHLNGNLAKTWILHLDEESMVSAQTVNACIAWIRSGKGLVAEGPIFYSTDRRTSLFTRLSESMRAFDCHRNASELISQEVPYFFQGSNILVRADIEKAVGWNHGPTLGEDQIFGFEVARQKHPTGWHGGIIVESSPYTHRDLVRQRKRWVVATLQNRAYMTFRNKVKCTYRVAVWNLNAIGAFIAVPLWIETFTGHYLFGFDFPLWLRIPLYVSLFTWLGSYAYGFWLNKSYGTPDSSPWFETMWLGLSFWFIGLTENLPALAGLIDHLRGRAEWVVTPKNGGITK